MQVAEGTLRIEDLQTVLGDEYSIHTLETELYREYMLPNGRRYRIDDPQFLVVRKGGSTHRVICADGLTHCIPWEGLTTLTWKNRDPLVPCEF
jgi:hypothetical protein